MFKLSKVKTNKRKNNKYYSKPLIQKLYISNQNMTKHIMKISKKKFEKTSSM